MDEHADALVRMRSHCQRQAAQLLANPPREELLRSVVLDVLRGMQDEAQAVAEADRESVNAYLTGLSQDPMVWATLAGLMGAAVALPGVVAASLTLTAFSLLGANAVKAHRAKEDLLKKSPWTVVYYAKAELGGTTLTEE